MSDDYPEFRRLRVSITGIEADGTGYLLSLFQGDPKRMEICETLISRIRRNEPVDIPREFFDARIGWPQMIKALRTVYGISITEAQDLALRHDGWLTWVKQRCRTDKSCARQAHHVARHGRLNNWIALKDGKVVFLK